MIPWRPASELPADRKDGRRVLWWFDGAGFPVASDWQSFEDVADALLYWADIPEPRPIAELPENRKDERFMLWWAATGEPSCCRWDEIEPIAEHVTHWADITHPVDGWPCYDDHYTAPTATR